MIHQTKRSQNFQGELSSHEGEIGATLIKGSLKGGGALSLLNNYNEIVFDTESKLVIFYSLTNS